MSPPAARGQVDAGFSRLRLKLPDGRFIIGQGMPPSGKISIITPSFGQLDWLRLCVASVADQSVGAQENGGGKGTDRGDAVASGSPNPQSSILHPVQPPLEIEHIVQDGGTPGIEEFAREVGAEFYRDGKPVFGSRPPTSDARPYRLAIYSESDAGMYDALNRGIARMSGDLWAWINSDEQYLPGTLAFVVEWFGKHPNVDILCGDAVLTDDRGAALSYRRIVKPKWLHTRLVHLASASCSSFYRRSVTERGGVFDIQWRSLGDAEWMARMLKAGIRVESCGRLLSSFAFTGQNTSESPLAAREAARWRAMPDAPPSWLRIPSILAYRCRKFLAGAYFRRTVGYAIHRRGEGRSPFHAARIGWGWPSAPIPSAVPKGDPDRRRSLPADTTDVLGVPLMKTTYEELSSTLTGLVSKSEACIAVDFANTHVVTMRRHNPGFSRLAECIDLTVPDGMPLVWAMNRKGAGLKDRVYGPTFTRKFLASCPAGATHYLVGGSEECGRRFRERMTALNPTLRFVGGYHGKCSVDGLLEDDDAVIGELRAKRPDFVWVGLGTPKQYAWICRAKPRLDHGVMLAVGFAFDVNAGMKPDAPLWMQRAGLTWLYRMGSEPRRLVGRYLKWNTLFLRYLAGDLRLGLRPGSS